MEFQNQLPKKRRVVFDYLFLLAGSPVPQQLPQRLKKTPILPFSIGPSARLN